LFASLEGKGGEDLKKKRNEQVKEVEETTLLKNTKPSSFGELKNCFRREF